MALKNVLRCIALSSRHVKFKFFWNTFVRSKHVYCSQQRMMFDAQSRIAYFKREDESEYFSLSVLVEHENLNLSKNIIVCKLTESPLGHLLQRLNLKIYSILDKLRKKKSKNPISESEIPEIRSLLYVDGKQLGTDFICRNIFELNGDIKLEILGDVYSVICNAPWVNSISLPKKIKSDIVLYPQKFHTSFMDKDKSTFKWYRSGSEDPRTHSAHVKEWVEVGDSYFYRVTDDDIGHYIKFYCIPRNDKLTGPGFTEVSASVVEPSECSYHFKNAHLLTKEKADNSKVRVVTYNILADMYATTKEGKVFFEYCPPSAMNRDQRLSAICCEIIGYNSDVVCLQEVEVSAFQGYLLPQLSELNYSGICSPKLSEREGTAIFYNKDKFKFLGSVNFAYGEQIVVNPFLKDVFYYVRQNTKFLDKLKSLPHSLQLVALESRVKQDQLIVVGNVHLYSSPEADLIRLIQALCSFCLFECFKQELTKKVSGKQISLILCGDFNSTPECSVHELVMNGLLGSDHEIWSSPEMEGIKGMSYKLPLKMDSACGAPKFTNYTKLFKGCLDYIYYQTDILEVDKAYPTPDEEILSAHVGLPSICFPSDHVPIIADLKWKC